MRSDTKIQHFTDIEAWKHGHKLVLEVYRVTKDFPEEEKFGVIGQIRRAATSVTANIAEGMGRFSYKDRVRFLYMSRGSIYEVENFCILAKDLGYLNREDFKNILSLINGARKILNGFVKSTETLA